MSSCTICNNQYDRQFLVPRNLPCGHVFCENCIKDISKISDFLKIY